MQATRPKIWSWFSIAEEIGVHESTVKRWARQEPSFRRIVRRWRRRVFVYTDELAHWRRSMEHGLIDEPLPEQARQTNASRQTP